MESHMESAMKRHLELTCKRLQQQEERLVQASEEHNNWIVALEKNIEKLTSRCNLEKENDRFTWEICGLKSISGSEKPFFSDYFFLRGYRMILFLCLGDPMNRVFDTRSVSSEHVCVGFHVARGKFDAELEWPFRKKLLFVLAEQGHSVAKPLTRISFQPEEIARPVTPTDDKTVAGKPMKRLAGLSLLKEVSTKYLVTVEFAVE